MGVRFEIQLNGGRAVAAGRDALDVLTAMVTFVRSQREIELKVGGLQKHGDGSSEHIEWVSRELVVGDEIRIRVVDIESSSEPIAVEREDGTRRDQREREYYERLKRRYESDKP